MAKMGRPAKEINEAQLRALMRLKPTQEDVAAFFECHLDTIGNHIKKHFGGLTFSEFREQNMVHTRFNLIRIAIQKAENGDNVMLIFCLKNLCGWRDRPADEDDPIKKMSTEQLIEMVTKMLEALKAK